MIPALRLTSVPLLERRAMLIIAGSIVTGLAARVLFLSIFGEALRVSDTQLALTCESAFLLAPLLLAAGMARPFGSRAVAHPVPVQVLAVIWSVWAVVVVVSTAASLAIGAPRELARGVVQHLLNLISLPALFVFPLGMWLSIATVIAFAITASRKGKE